MRSISFARSVGTPSVLSTVSMDGNGASILTGLTDLTGTYSFLKTRLMWKCLDCQKQFSVKVGTIFEDSPIGLDKWLCAMWLVANCKNGVSSYEIARDLKVTQATAWFMLHRIRYAMHHGTINKMTGTVEADHTFIGGKARNMHAGKRAEKIRGRGPMGKACVRSVGSGDRPSSRLGCRRTPEATPSP